MVLVEFFLFLFSVLSPKSKSVILFSAWGGMKKSDNSAALFDFMSKEYPKLLCYYILKSKSEYNRYKDDARVVYAWSIKGIFLHLIASTFIYSSGYSDFIRCFISPRATRINLWHGVPLKKIGYDDSYHQPIGLRRVMRDFRDLIFPFSSNKADYILSTHEQLDEVFRTAFRPKKGVITGSYPRLDYVSQSASRVDALRSVLGVPVGGRVIMYMPTFRDSGIGELLTISDLREIEHFCVSNNFWFLVKSHPVDDILSGVDITEFKHVIDISSSSYDTYQDLFPICDILVTDYSSVSFDFIHFSNSLYLYCPDLLQYLNSSREMYIAYDDITNKQYYVQFSDLLIAIANGTGFSATKHPHWKLHSVLNTGPFSNSRFLARLIVNEILLLGLEVNE